MAAPGRRLIAGRANIYLTEAFSPDLPGRQVFVAPGLEDSLHEDPSPWIRGRTVCIPARYWHRLLLLIRDKSVQAAADLDSWSGSADPDDDAGVLSATDKMSHACTVMGEVIAELKAGKSLAEKDLEQLGDYGITDCARMLDGVRLVLHAAMDSRQPFFSWIE